MSPYSSPRRDQHHRRVSHREKCGFAAFLVDEGSRCGWCGLPGGVVLRPVVVVGALASRQEKQHRHTGGRPCPSCVDRGCWGGTTTTLIALSLCGVPPHPSSSATRVAKKLGGAGSGRAQLRTRSPEPPNPEKDPAARCAHRKTSTSMLSGNTGRRRKAAELDAATRTPRPAQAARREEA